MSLNDARNFVIRMQVDQDFRQKAQETETQDSLTSLLLREGFQFDKRELAGAMAECIEQMEQQKSK